MLWITTACRYVSDLSGAESARGGRARRIGGRVQRDRVSGDDRLSVGPIAEGFPALLDVQRCFCDWRDSGRLEAIRFVPAMDVRELKGREASRTAGVIDSQSGKARESGGLRGYDAGKKIVCRKRHIVVDTRGPPFDIEFRVGLL